MIIISVYVRACVLCVFYIIEQNIYYRNYNQNKCELWHCAQSNYVKLKKNEFQSIKKKNALSPNIEIIKRERLYLERCWFCRHR